MKKLVVLLVVSLMATSAFAVRDTDPNSIGVYFDTAAEMTEFSATPGLSFMGYLILANPTEPELSGFEASYEVVLDPGQSYFRLEEDIMGGLNVAIGNSATLGEYVVGWPEPRASTSESIILVSWLMVVFNPDPDLGLDIYLGQTAAPAFDDGLPAIEVGGNIIPAGLSSGDASMPVAKVNRGTVVAEEKSSFGGVKALFR